MEAVYSVGATEATVLYCARTLEVLTGDAVARLGLDASASVFANLATLDQFGLLPRHALYLSHALRRIGNDVRHIKRPIGAEEGRLALALLEPCMEWFFCRFLLGPGVASLTSSGGPLFEALTGPVREFVEICCRLPASRESLLDLWGISQKELPSQAVLALLTELMIDHKEFELAQMVLDEGFVSYSTDLRLNQLQGLLWSRTGELHKAVEKLSELRRRSRDAETIGILAGAYKRLAHSSKGGDWLQRSHAQYSEGWKRLKDVYLGINAATTAVWLGRLEDGRELAEDVRVEILERAQRVHQATGDTHLGSDFWSRVTLAEADLITGRVEQARTGYQEAFAEFSEMVSAIEVAQAQATKLCTCLGQKKLFP